MESLSNAKYHRIINVELTLNVLKRVLVKTVYAEEVKMHHVHLMTIATISRD